MKVGIIGGGIIGLSIANALTEQSSCSEISVFEQKKCGSGASWLSAGLHFPLGRKLVVQEMTKWSSRFFENDVPEYWRECITPLSMVLHSIDSARGSIQDVHCHETNLQKVGNELFGNENLVSYEGGAAHYCDVPKLVEQIQQKLSQKIAFYEGNAVEALNQDGQKLNAMLSNGEVLELDKVILCPGPWIQQPIVRDYFPDLEIKVKKIVAFHLDATVLKSEKVHVFVDDDAFLMPLPEERKWLFSYTCSTWNVSPNDVLKISSSDSNEALQVLHKYLPGFSGSLSNGRAFCDAYGTCCHPIVNVSSISNSVIFAGAAGGSGYRLAPAIVDKTLELLN